MRVGFYFDELALLQFLPLSPKVLLPVTGVSPGLLNSFLKGSAIN